MYFKRLELVGFKSFMDKTDLNFEPGITAIVGPNGCGKSNIFDAIRWVLGEQSVKSLRGSNMEDVIFNGTDTKQPVGMAEVSLTFDNEGKHFSVDHDEVMITRRIFRSGESEYLINKAQVRLKDIQDLLLGTGIGAESYSIIAQGKIDLILSSKPEDRRMVFDEASGITKYKAQKREALRKLEDTELNLLRLNDIITEVKRSIGYLERQANKARRYQATFEELKNREKNLALLQKDNLVKEKYQITRQIGMLKENEEIIQSEIKEQESRIDQRKLELESLEQDLSSIKNLIVDSQNFIQRNNQQINFNHERIEELKGTASYLGTQITQTKDRLAKDEGKLAQLKEEYLNVKKNLEEKSLSLKDKEAKLDDIVLSIKNSLETIAQAKKDILELVQKISQAKNELADLTSRQQVNLARQKRLDIEKAKVIEEKMQAEENLNALLAEFLQLEKDCSQLKIRIQDVRTELEKETAVLSRMNEELDGLEKQRLSLVSQKEFLEKLKSQYEDIDESMNAQIYLDKLPKEKINGLVVKIKEYDTFAYSDSSNFKLSGEAKPIDLDAQRINQKIQEIEEKLAVLKNNRLAVESHIQELNIVLGDISLKSQEQELALENKRAVHHSALEQFKKIKDEEEIIILELSDVENEITGLQERIDSLKANLAQLETENKSFEDTIHGQQENINTNAKRKEEVLVAITQLKTEIENLTKDLDSEDATFKMQEEAVRLSSENILHQEAKLKETLDRRVSLAQEIEGLEEKNIVLRQEIEVHTGSLGDEEQRYKQLQDSLDEITKVIDEKRQKHDQLKENVYQMQMVQKDLDFKYQSIKERMLSTYKLDLDTLEISVSAQATQEVQPEAIKSTQDNSPVDQTQENPPAARTAVWETDEAKLSAEIEKLKERIESYGTVNLVAIEEYDELKKRYDFLTQQQTDLVTAKESLQEAIQKINRTTKKMFIETFEKVREEFRNYFRMLFNGGDAQVFLIDENDPLESGIEIICRPPGKKLQNVLLLSGGEKALAAIALIFAIFKVKPAPFCVLDEIDAALDESNVDRFGRLLQEFADTSQFIVITHNKRTIANAGVMYGITMQESGVSKIVSVKFGSDKKKEKHKAPEPVAA